jgi:hypothetical protein
VVYRQLVADAKQASPGGHTEATTTSSAADPTPTVDSSDKSQPGLDHEPTLPSHDTAGAGGATGPRAAVPPQHQTTSDARTTRQTRHSPTPARRRKLDLT